MPTDAEKRIGSFDVYARDVIAPSLVDAREPLSAEACVVREPVSIRQASGARFRPVTPGWEWGPAWATCWFRLRGRLPALKPGQRPQLRFATDTEALLWLDGAPSHGLDVNRDLAPLPMPAPTGRREPGRGTNVTLLVEAACNHPFGASALQWDTPDTARRWASPTPGRFLYAEAVTLHEPVRRLLVAWRMVVDLARELAPPAPPAATPLSIFVGPGTRWQDGRCEELLLALQAATNELDRGDLPGTAARALRHLQAAISQRSAGSTTICHAVGHAHIDTAWLWPIRETRRKCLRTFSSVLSLMDRHPEFRFVCTQAQQYAWVEADAPELFTRIARRVADGRWEPGGGMWVEPDCSVPTFESLVRQVLHGSRYWRSRFGDKAPQAFLFLPDTFGFPAHLPQVMRHTGLRTFITNKLAWNDTTPFPHTTFSWKGHDGTEVLAHCTPGIDYNATNSPRELRRGEINHRSRQVLASPARARAAGAPEGGARWLQPFGFGDGGGGPTQEMIERAEWAADCDGLPRIRQGRVDAFCEALHADAAAARRQDALPVWTGELYLELHRGTLTTQSWLKRAMRRAEDDLRWAEALGVMRWAQDRSAGGRRARALAAAELDEAWKLTLLNQFHDILPGSSIARVYQDARQHMDRVHEITQAQIDRHTRAIAATLDRAAQPGILAANPASTPARQVVDAGGALRLISTPALSVGFAPPVRVAPAEHVAIEVDEHAVEAVLKNSQMAARIDRFGRVTELYLVGGPAVVGAGEQPLHALVTYDDLPRLWDAWDIDESHQHSPTPQLAEPDAWSVTERDPLRASVRISRPLGRFSRITQTFSLDALSPRLNIHTVVDWREERTLLRVLFPTSIHADVATFDISGGSITRSTRTNTAAERAAFEVPAHRWVDLSEHGRGLAVLNESIYGHSCRGGEIGMSLLRSTRYPDPAADQGLHEFTYAIMPHRGDWRSAGVPEEAERLHRPVRLAPPTTRRTAGVRGGPALRQAVSIHAPGHDGRACVHAIKWSQDGERVIVRIQERRGARGEVRVAWHLPIRSAQPVDGLENPTSLDGHAWLARTRESVLQLKPFECVTLAATVEK